MVSLTEKEREALLVLFKDFTAYYNANSISKVLGISHVGAQKIFKRLLKDGIIKDQQIGKSIVRKLRLEDDYVRKLIAFLLADEANNFKRWKEEFKELFKKDRIVIMFGSAVKDYKAARDIDIMIVIDKKDYKEVKKLINDKREILPKSIHSIELTEDDLINNIKKRQEAVIDIVKNGIVLYGQDTYVGIIKNVASF
jgi:DNA-binding Lrp family transcriptional regulator